MIALNIAVAVIRRYGDYVVVVFILPLGHTDVSGLSTAFGQDENDTGRVLNRVSESLRPETSFSSLGRRFWALVACVLSLNEGGASKS